VYESLPQSDNGSDQTSAADESVAPELVDRVVDVLGGDGGRAAGLVTDVDGTIAPIVERPEDARVLPAARAALDGLKDVLALVGVVSGRRAVDAQRLVGLSGLVYVGNHGFERLDQRGEPHIVPEAQPWVARLAALLEDLQGQLSARPGITLENKGATASLHYRLAPDRERARQELLDILAASALARGLLIEEGRRVLNVFPPLPVNKGSAVAALVEQYKLQRVVYFGDDVTDTHAFTALRSLRNAGQVRSLSIGVVGPETPPSVGRLADATVPSAAAVADVLCQVLDRLRRR
jgi:trehalose 6-phosphate phosphatase